MIKQIWTVVLIQPLLNALVGLYFLTGNFGLAIIGLTLIISIISIPLMLPSLKAAEKMKDLQPQLAKLKERWKDDKEKLAKAQMDFYREKGINPMSGCLPQILRLVLLIALYNAFQRMIGAHSSGNFDSVQQLLYPFLKLPEGFSLNLKFLYLDLGKPDIFRFNNIPLPGLFLIGAAVTQFISSKMMMPGNNSNRKSQIANLKDNKPEEKKEDMMQAFQSQSLYMMPLMTIVFGYSFPGALVLYWLVMSLVMMIQQLWLKKVNKD